MQLCCVDCVGYYLLCPSSESQTNTRITHSRRKTTCALQSRPIFCWSFLQPYGIDWIYFSLCTQYGMVRIYMILLIYVDIPTTIYLWPYVETSCYDAVNINKYNHKYKHRPKQQNSKVRHLSCTRDEGMKARLAYNL